MVSYYTPKYHDGFTTNNGLVITPRRCAWMISLIHKLIADPANLR